MALKIRRHLHVSFADEVAPNVPEPPYQITRRKLQGAEHRRRQKIIKKKSLKSGVLSDHKEYEVSQSIPDIFEDIIMELSLDDLAPVEDIYSDNCEAYTDVELSKRLCCDDSQSLGTASDSGLGESFTEEMMFNCVDGVCEQLLMYCETRADRLNAVIISGLIQSETPELFVNAGLCTSVVGVQGLLEFAHGGGDIHTALRVVLAWMKEKRSQKNPDMSKWCLTHGICYINLKNIINYIRDLEYLGLWTDEPIENDYTVHRCVDDKITTMLTANFSGEICYYLGHPSLGYKNLRTGDRIPCCPASSFHFLDEFPNFALSCSTRHKHFSNNEDPCHYLVALDDCVGLQLAADLPGFTTEYDFLNDRVSPVNSDIKCGSETCRKIYELWNYPKEEFGITLQQELSSMCNNCGVAIDIIDNRYIKLFAPDRHHEFASEFIQDKIQQVRNEIAESKVLQPFSRSNSAFKFLLSPGIQCDFVQLPGDRSINNEMIGSGDNTGTSGTIFDATTEVELEVKVNSMNNTHQAFAEDLKQCTILQLRTVLQYIHPQLWSFQSLDIGKSSINTKLYFQTPAAARRAMQLISEEKYMKIINVAQAERQCRSMKIKVDSRVFSCVADGLKSKLEQLTRSSKYRLEYTITKEVNHIFIIATTVQNILVNDVIQMIHQICVPSIFVPPHVNRRSKIDIHGEEFKFVLQLIGQKTGTVLNLIRITGNVAIYGSRALKKEASAYLTKCLSNTFENIWLPIGVPLCALDAMPRDFMLCFYNNSTFNSSVDAKDTFFHVDFSKKMIWAQIPEDFKDISDQFLRSNIVHQLQINYGIEISEELVQFEDTDKKEFTCVTCYGDTRDFYTLEVCQHTYCYECINTQILTALNEKKLPISCAECDTLLSIADMNNLIKSRQVPDCKRRNITMGVLTRFVAQNNELYHFCSRPDCDGLFKKLPKRDGGLICGACATEMCEKCYEKAHYGMNCVEYMEIGKWMDEDRKNRKMCPKCSMKIMKDGGCNNVKCQHCKMNICWVCLEFDEISKTIYDHMSARNHWS